MKAARYLVMILLLHLAVLGVKAIQQEEGINAIKTVDGFVLVWNQPGIYFTVAVKGKDVRPLNSTEHVFFNVDGVVFQVQSVAISKFMKDAQKKKPDDKSILAAHREWESKFIESTLLGKKLNVQTVPQKLSNGSEALLWKFEMPETPGIVNGGAKEQIYLTVVSGDHIILLNGVVEAAVAEDTVQKFLLDTILTLNVSLKPINLRQLQESIRKGNFVAPKAPESFIDKRVTFSIPTHWLIQSQEDTKTLGRTQIFIPYQVTDNTPHSANAAIIANTVPGSVTVKDIGDRIYKLHYPGMAIIDDIADGKNWRTIVWKATTEGAPYLMLDRFGLVNGVAVEFVVGFPLLKNGEPKWVDKVVQDFNSTCKSLKIDGTNSTEVKLYPDKLPTKN